MSSTKTVQKSTFLKWDLTHVIGYDAEDRGGTLVINKVWCKVCAKHIANIIKDSRIRGLAQKETQKFVEGTSFITKHTVQRHLNSQVRL